MCFMICLVVSQTPASNSLLHILAQFDYRVLHRGTTNKSAEMRPILVFTFAKPWYKVS